MRTNLTEQSMLSSVSFAVFSLIVEIGLLYRPIMTRKSSRAGCSSRVGSDCVVNDHIYYDLAVEFA
jgi:hypothetical protein